MGRFKDIAAGTRAIKRVPLPLANMSAVEREKSGAPTPEVGLRVLTGSELATVLEKAITFSRARGVDRPDEENPIYNLGVSVYTCAVACVDPDSDPSMPQPFFGILGDVESAADEILKAENLGRDCIMYLAEQHEFWQDECNPQTMRLDGLGAVWKMAEEVAADESPKAYLSLRPAARWSFTRSMAGLLSSLLKGKLPSGFSSNLPMSAAALPLEPGSEKPS